MHLLIQSILYQLCIRHIICASILTTIKSDDVPQLRPLVEPLVEFSTVVQRVPPEHTTHACKCHNVNCRKLEHTTTTTLLSIHELELVLVVIFSTPWKWVIASKKDKTSQYIDNFFNDTKCWSNYWIFKPQKGINCNMIWDVNLIILFVTKSSLLVF